MVYGRIIIEGNILMGGVKRDIPLLTQPSGLYDLSISLLGTVFIIFFPLLVSRKK